MKINYKKTHINTVEPSHANTYDAGVDLTAVEVEKSGNWFFPLYTYRTGIALQLPKTHFAMLVPRSSLSKKLMWLANHVGIIDTGYTGELIFKFRSILGIKPYKVGERIGQMVLFRRNRIEMTEVTSDLVSNDQRGEGGFGSTGK